MNSLSISSSILPGNKVVQKTRRGTERLKYTELQHGYFWMIRELKSEAGDKPILSNTELIPENKAKPFPPLLDVQQLSTSDKVDLPDYFLRKNRLKDPQAQCTLVAVSFRDYGYQLLPTWLEPFRQVFGANPRVETIQLNIAEGYLSKYLLRGFIQGFTKKNTPPEQQDQTLLYFASDLEGFRDQLRMHNIMTGYVFLLDGLGRVRFAGSGTATDDEVKRLVAVVHELVPRTVSSSKPSSLSRKSSKRR